MSKRIYIVSCEDFKPAVRLVRANSVAQAIGHVVGPEFQAHVASQDDLIKLAKTHEVEEVE